LQQLDLEGDWDPDAHDAQMSRVYGNDEDEDNGDMEKPIWNDDINIDDIVPEMSNKKKKKKKKSKQNETHEDGVDLDEMDADAKPLVDDEEWDGTEEMRKRKLDEYMDELYGLEFNDMVRISRQTSFSVR
jgi:protein KRI1